MQCILKHIIHAKEENMKLKYEKQENCEYVEIMKSEQVCVKYFLLEFLLSKTYLLSIFIK